MSARWNNGDRFVFVATYTDPPWDACTRAVDPLAPTPDTLEANLQASLAEWTRIDPWTVGARIGDHIVRVRTYSRRDDAMRAVKAHNLRMSGGAE